jgi:hypothetical protein
MVAGILARDLEAVKSGFVLVANQGIVIASSGKLTFRIIRQPRKMADKPVAKHVVILVHRHGSFDEPLYYLREIAELWRASGIDVTVLYGPRPGVKADLAILHVDLTVTPDDHLDFMRQFPAAINAAVADISKRAISANLVKSGDGYDGPVIVKTNRNAGGYMEAFLAARGLMPRSPTRSPTCPPDQYPILKSARDVTQAVWDHPDLVVEKFLPEFRDGCYCLRNWVFLGDKEIHAVMLSKHPIVKSTNMLRRQPLGEVPDALRQMRRRMKFDFGKFDYVMVDGRVVLYDANRTPGLIHVTREQYMPRIKVLAEGIHAFL